MVGNLVANEIMRIRIPLVAPKFGYVDQWLDRLVVSQEVGGSSPLIPAKYAQVAERLCKRLQPVMNASSNLVLCSKILISKGNELL